MKSLHRAGVMLLTAVLLLGILPASALAGTGDGAPANRGYGSGNSSGVKFYDVSYYQPGTVDFVILPYGTAQPSAEQVKSHQDASGASVAADYCGTREATGSGDQYDAVLLRSDEAPYINLAPGKYCVYTVCTDEDGTSGVTYCNFDGLPYSLEVKTALTVTVESASVRIEGATVKIGADIKTTDSNGQTIFTLSAGTYTYLVQKSGFTGVSYSYTADKQTDTKTVSLTAGSGGDYSAVLNIKDDKGTNLKNAKVTIGSDTKTADENGSVEFFLTSGTYSYSASALGRITKTGSITINEANTDGNIELINEPDGADLVITGHQMGKLGDEMNAILDANCLSADEVGSITVHDGVMDSSDFYYSHGGMEKLWAGENILSSVDLSDTTLYNNLLPESAFRGATHLNSITLPNAVTEIGAYAFAYCPLTAFTFPESVEVIGDSVFQYCTSLESVTFPSGVTSFGDYLFSASYYGGMAPVKDIYMSAADPASVTVSGNAFFNNSDAVLHVDESLIDAYASDSRDGSTTDGQWYGLWIDDPGAVPVISGEPARYYESQAYFYFLSDFPGQYYYAIVDDGDPVPTINTSGTGTALSNLEGEIKFTRPTTAKDIYIVLKGINGNLSNVLKMDIPVAGTSSIDVTITGHTAGDIRNEINVKLTEANLSYNYNNVGSLTVNGGTINGDDASVISSLPLTSANFSGTSFADGEIPDGLLYGCSSLTTLVLPNSVTAIGEYTFSELALLENVTLGSAVPPTLGEYAFASGEDDNGTPDDYDDDFPVYDHGDAVVYVPSGSVSAYQTAEDNDATDGKWYGFTVEEFEPTPAAKPTVTTDSATGVTASSATLNGNVTNEGGATVTERGFVYGTSANPEIDGSKVVADLGTGTGAFSATLSELMAGTTYHARAYAISGAGTAYGEVRTFSTSAGGLSGRTAPKVKTAEVSSVTTSGATLSGSVGSMGSGHVTARGFVIGTAPDPELGGTDVINIPVSGGTGSFTATVDSLLPATTYYVRAYAMNVAGVGYGQNIPLATGFIGDGKNGIPKTGDGSNLLPVLLCAAAVSAVVGITLRRRSYKNM